MKQSKFRRWLEEKGATFVEGSKHTKVKLSGKQTTLPRHPNKEIREGTRKAIIKQLGIKE
ncbi:MAG: type II toxin-antitoxin system HicA family toxin [Burkholderiales bacterium]|nr:type II toxin-antitoxin system HicA family toxin [Burkholderiales bacterium]